MRSGGLASWNSGDALLISSASSRSTTDRMGIRVGWGPCLHYSLFEVWGTRGPGVFLTQDAPGECRQDASATQGRSRPRHENALRRHYKHRNPGEASCLSSPSSHPAIGLLTLSNWEGLSRETCCEQSDAFVVTPSGVFSSMSAGAHDSGPRARCPCHGMPLRAHYKRVLNRGGDRCRGTRWGCLRSGGRSSRN